MDRNDTVSLDVAREAMFEKALTPSDVGKLNRLVIPKQHAEKHFPQLGNAAAGTLLELEDEAGKCWRFRYSYWNSSQSYVLTKGWSRYVKEKRLDAGDVVYFQRHRGQPERTFIGWRRRRLLPAPAREGEVAESSNGGRRLVRLFGVNFECQPSSQATTSCEMSAQQQQLQLQQQQGYGYYFDHSNTSTSTHQPPIYFLSLGNELSTRCQPDGKWPDLRFEDVKLRNDLKMGPP